jgi:hypothetical protein
MEPYNSFTQSEEKFYEMTMFLQSNETNVLDLSGLEEFLFQQGKGLLRRLLCDHLVQRGAGDIGDGVLGADGIYRTHKRHRKRTIITLFGPIVIDRIGYSLRHVSSLFPLDAILNLPVGKISYTVQRHFVLEAIENSFHTSCKTVKRWSGITISNRQAELMIHHAAQEFTTFYHTRTVSEANTLPLLVLTSDGKGVFVKTEDLRPATRQKALQKTSSEKGAESASGHTFSKRMATVASVYEIARYRRRPCDIAADFFTGEGTSKRPDARPKPSSKRVWAELKAPGKTVIEDIFQEAMRRDVHQNKEWVVLVDGDLNQIKHVQRAAQLTGVSPTIICDIIHVLRYLWKAGKAMESQDRVKDWVHQKFQQILQGKSRCVAAGMRRWATRRTFTKSHREPIDDCARYFVNHAPYMAYHEYLEKGYPIATGVIEGTCRYLVKDRMEITGARWGLQGAEALLQLRAIECSGDFDEYWKFYEQKQYEKNYQCLYKNPDVLRPKKTH